MARNTDPKTAVRHSRIQGRPPAEVLGEVEKLLRRCGAGTTAQRRWAALRAELEGIVVALERQTDRARAQTANALQLLGEVGVRIRPGGKAHLEDPALAPAPMAAPMAASIAVPAAPPAPVHAPDPLAAAQATAQATAPATATATAPSRAPPPPTTHRRRGAGAGMDGTSTTTAPPR
jgi:hypothetical protein